MNATKRKFNALLSGIGNKSTTSLSSKEVNNASQTDLTPANDLDSQAKKRRTSNSDSISSQNTSHVTSKLLTKSSTKAMPYKKSTSLATAVVTTESPKYTPWDREEFLKRLKSFSNLTDWTPKPARVNEVEWAKRGWVCQKFERVRCCLCNVEILVKLNKKEVDGKEEPVYVAQNIEDALVDKYVELIVSSHEENCLWRKRGCDDSIFKLSLNNAEITIQTLRERYNELYNRSENLPYSFNIRTPPNFDLDLILSYLPNNFFVSLDKSEDVPPAKVNKVAFIMALFGWQGYKHERLGVQSGSVSCQACFRVLGLWIFKSKEINQAGEEVANPVVNCLDVVKEHRDYCPWRNAASQNGQKATDNSESTALAGWEIVLRVLKNDHYFRHGNEIQAARASVSVASKPVASDAVSEIHSTLDEDEDAKSRDEKDSQRWARLKRVKSLFDTKGGKKGKRPEAQGKPAAG
ncbi:mRNA export factor rsm1 [Lachnellula cervina]|uniref:mRNA export factor rsm1 n=1 Tax=Lachnellula cervina TaxID=1316786 RepID=A0A7D8UP68_9HELO|nr:mRNA export factor rsm1 [Lachnellula cervina]